MKADPDISSFRRGELVQMIADHDRRLNALNGSIDKMNDALQEHGLAIARITTRVSIFSAAAAAAGAGAITLLGKFL